MLFSLLSSQSLTPHTPLNTPSSVLAFGISMCTWGLMPGEGGFGNAWVKICPCSGKALGALAHIFPYFGLANIQFCQEALGNSPLGVTSSDSSWLSCLGGDGRCVTCKQKKWLSSPVGSASTAKDWPPFAATGCWPQGPPFWCSWLCCDKWNCDRGCASLWGTGIGSCQGLTTNMEQNKSLKALYQEYKSSRFNA